MIINGFGNSGGNGLLDENKWKDIVTMSATNFACSSMQGKTTHSNAVTVASNTDINAWDFEVLDSSMAIKVVANTWVFSGTHTADSSTATMYFIMSRSTSDSNGGRYGFFERAYQGVFSSASADIESIRHIYSGYASLLPLQGVYITNGTANYKVWYFHASAGTTSSPYFTYIGIKLKSPSNIDEYEGTWYGLPSLYGYGASAHFANTKLTCSLTIKGYTG